MSNKENFTRRQFVKRTAVVSGAAAISATVASKVTACPIWRDENGKIADWFCIVDYDSSNPVYTLYTWENCRTGDQSTTLGDPGMPLGDCGNAPSDSSCYKGIDMEEWDKISIQGKQYLIMPNTTGRALREAVTCLNRSKS